MQGLQADYDSARRPLIQLRDDVDELLEQLSWAECTWSRRLADVATVHRASARNMVHYWSLRQRDLRDLQDRLSSYGLSSLGRSEPHVEATLLSVKSAIDAMLGEGLPNPFPAGSTADQGDDLLRIATQNCWDPTRKTE